MTGCAGGRINIMEIYVNQKKIDYQPLFPLTWKNFFQKMLQDENYIAKDHGIVGIIVDNVEAMEVMMEQSDRMIPQITQKVEILTKDSLSITQDGFGKSQNLIDSIINEISATADLYREGKINEAAEKVKNVLEAIQPMINFVQSVGTNFKLDFDQIYFNPTTNVTLQAKIESFLKTIEEVVNSMQKKDYVEIADYLEYQLQEDMSDWKTLINVLLKEVEAGFAKSS